nr:hypothetical protein [uncultured Eisenbergiella sp.]
MRIFTHEDCDHTGYGFSLKNKVVVLPRSVLPCEHSGQLFFCTGGNGAKADPIGRSVFLVSLTTGEPCCFFRKDVIGTLKPELLPEEEKLQLSQIRPNGAADLKTHEPQYSGYSFLKDGRYASGVWLCSLEEVGNYVEMQKPYQHRVLICDRDDFSVMEVVDGQLVFPTQEDMEAHQQEQKGGMEMQ